MEDNILRVNTDTAMSIKQAMANDFPAAVVHVGTHGPQSCVEVAPGRFVVIDRGENSAELDRLIRCIEVAAKPKADDSTIKLERKRAEIQALAERAVAILDGEAEDE